MSRADSITTHTSKHNLKSRQNVVLNISLQRNVHTMKTKIQKNEAIRVFKTNQRCSEIRPTKTTRNTHNICSVKKNLDSS